MSWYAGLSWDGGEIEIGDGSTHTGFNASSSGIEGWYSTPPAKWSLTERSISDGAFIPDEADIIYSARTVTLGLIIEGSSRDELVTNQLALLEAAHHMCTLVVADGSHKTYVEGLLTVADSAGTISNTKAEVEITLECPDPRRLAAPNTDGCHVVYAYTDSTVDNSTTIGGITKCYPVIVVSGDMASGFQITMSRWISSSDTRNYATYYTNAVTSDYPVTLDYRNGRALVNDVDYSKYLTQRGFVGLDPGNIATFGLYAGDGSGTAKITLCDAYI